MRAISPKDFLDQNARRAEAILVSLVEHAKRSSEMNCVVDVFVPVDLRQLLHELAVKQGFTNITYHDDQREGSWVVLHSNPHAANNLAAEVDTVVAVINTLLKRHGPSAGGYITLQVQVATRLQTSVQARFLSEGWKKVEFQSDQREGDWINLYY